MLQLVTNYFCAGLAAISILLFTELCINFKRPLNLKITLLSISFSVIFYCLGIIYCYYTRYNRWIVEMPSTFITAIALCFFSILYLQKIKKYVFVFAASMITVQLFFFFYYSFVSPVDVSINLGSIKSLLYTRICFRLLYTIGSLWLIGSLYKKVLIKYDGDNLYHKYLKQWSLVLLLCINPIWIANLIKVTNLTSESIEQLVRLTGYLGCIICFLFRPKFLNKISSQITLFDKLEKQKGTDKEVNVTSFENMFFTNLFYLNKEASLQVIATKLEVTEDLLNSFITNQYGVSYNDLLNKSRVSYFVELINTSKHKDITIDALAQKAGFGTRQHLYKHFKRFHGGTPSDLLKALNEPTSHSLNL